MVPHFRRPLGLPLKRCRRRPSRGILSGSNIDGFDIYEISDQRLSVQRSIDVQLRPHGSLSPILLESLLLSLLGLLAVTWFRGGNLLWWSDTGIPLSLPWSEHIFYIQDPHDALTPFNVRSLPAVLPLGLLLKCYEVLKLPYSSIAFEKLLAYALFAISGLSMLLLLSVAPRTNRFVRLTGSLLYMFNFYSVRMWSAVALPELIFGYSFLPFLVFLQIKALRSGPKWQPMACAALWTMLGTIGYVIPAKFFTDFLAFTVMLVVIAGVSRKSVRRVSTAFLLFGTSWLILNSFWIAPLAVYGRIQASRYLITGSAPLEVFRSNSSPMFFAFILTSPWLWGYVQEMAWIQPFTGLAFMALGCLFPVLSFAAVLLRRNAYTISFALLSILFLFLVTGSSTGWRYWQEGLFLSLGLVTVFRSVYDRFIPYVVLGFVVLSAIMLDALRKRQSEERVHWFRGALCYGILAILIMPSMYPMLTGNVMATAGDVPSKRIQIPASYEKMAQWLDRDASDVNILTLPLSRDGTFNLLWDGGSKGFQGAYPLIYLSQKNFIIESDVLGGKICALVSALDRGDLVQADSLGMYGMKYVLLHHDIDSDRFHWPQDCPVKNSELMGERLKRVRGLRLAAVFGDISVYENQEVSPYGMVYAIPEFERTRGFGDILENETTRYIRDFDRLNPTLYRVTVRAERPFTLVFVGPYDQGWIARRTTLSAGEHGYELMGINAFHADPGEYELYIEYSPQQLVYNLEGVSAAALCLILLVAFCQIVLRNRRLPAKR